MGLLAGYALYLTFRGRHQAVAEPVLKFLKLERERFATLIAEDRAALSPLFSKIETGTGYEVPKCSVLFVYANIASDGSLDWEWTTRSGTLRKKPVLRLRCSQRIIHRKPVSPRRICQDRKEQSSLDVGSTAQRISTVLQTIVHEDENRQSDADGLELARAPVQKRQARRTSRNDLSAGSRASALPVEGREIRII